MKKILAAGLLCGAALVSTSAFAVPANATFNGSIANISFAGPNLRDATSINIGLSGVSGLGGVPATYLGDTNDFTDGSVNNGDGTTLPAVVNLPPTLPIANFLLFTTENGNRYSFQLETYTKLPSDSNINTFYGTGTFVDSLGTYDTSSDAAFLWSIQNLSGSISGSFSFGTPAFDNPVPAPGVLALIGIGLVGIGFARRKG
jgi:hypothetical protein